MTARNEPCPDGVGGGACSDSCRAGTLHGHALLQVAVFDDAEPEPSAALLGLAAVPLAPLCEGVPVQGPFTLTHPTTGLTAGTVWLSIAWHDPLAAAALGLRLAARVQQLQPVGNDPAAGMLEQQALQAAVSTGDPAVQALQAQVQQLQLQLQLQQQQQQPLQQQQQQHIHSQQQSPWPQLMQGPQLLPTVPMLLTDPQQQHTAYTLGISPAAAAAFGCSSQQQQQVPLLQNASGSFLRADRAHRRNR